MRHNPLYELKTFNDAVNLNVPDAGIYDGKGNPKPYRRLIGLFGFDFPHPIFRKHSSSPFSRNIVLNPVNVNG